MKLIACLIIVSSVFVFWSRGVVSTLADDGPQDVIALEQPHRDLPPWTRGRLWEAWGDWLYLPRRRWRGWTKLHCLLVRLGRQRQRRRLRHRELMCGRQAIELSTEPLAPNAEESAITAPHGPEPEASAGVALQQPVEESRPSVRQGPGRPRTIRTDHLCCPHEGCSALGLTGLVLTTTSLDAAPTRSYTERSGSCTCAKCVGRPYRKRPGRPSLASRHR